MANTGTRIEFRNVSKVFKTKDREVTAVDDVTLTVEPGEILGVIGYSGAGKSTLVRLINGLDMPTSGELLLDGTDIVGMPERKLREIRRNVGMIFQQFNLFSENYPEQLSGGQKQRVGIARALATNPSLLLADEATSALDPETTQEVLSVLRRVNEELGITIVVITHEMDVIRAIADKVAVMEDGKVVEYGSVYDVFANPQTAVAQRFAATSLRNRPDEVETQELLAKPGRLFTVDLTEDSGFFGAAEQARKRGVAVEPVHAGIATLQERSFGKMTVRLNGDNNVIDEFLATLQRNTEIEEITR